MGRVASYLVSDASLRRRIDITRLFTQHPGERMTIEEIREHTPGRVGQVRELLDELVVQGWLRTGRNEVGHIAYWRAEERRP